MPVVGQFAGLLALGVFPGGAFESIASVAGTGSSTELTFSSIPSTFQHLQVRGVFRSDRGSPGVDNVRIKLNGSACTHSHYLSGNGSSLYAGAVSAGGYVGEIPASTVTANVVAPCVIDILDYASTSKNTTYRLLIGSDRNGAGWAELCSGFLDSTAAISSLSFVTTSTSNFTTQTLLALYGVKAP